METSPFLMSKCKLIDQRTPPSKKSWLLHAAWDTVVRKIVRPRLLFFPSLRSVRRVFFVAPPDRNGSTPVHRSYDTPAAMKEGRTTAFCQSLNHQTPSAWFRTFSTRDPCIIIRTDDCCDIVDAHFAKSTVHKIYYRNRAACVRSRRWYITRAIYHLAPPYDYVRILNNTDAHVRIHVLYP